MFRRVLPALILGATVLAAAPACAVRARGHGPVWIVDIEPPPPRPGGVVIARPGYAWVAGRWEYVNYHWVWRDGYWMRARAGHVWRPGAWIHIDGRWHWKSGGWERHDRPHQPPPRQPRPHQPAPRPQHQDHR